VEVLGILGVVVALWLLISAAGAFPLLLLWFADFRYVADPLDTISQAIDATGKEWLAAVRFEPEGAIWPLGVRMALFRHRDNHTAMAVYFVAGRVVTDIATAFPNDVEITTTSTGDGVVAPFAPGSVMQCLPSLGLEDRWQKHLEGVQRLRQHLNAAEQPMGSLSESMGHSQRRQIRHVFTHPWLILTFPYRYFVLRLRYRNVTVTTQLDRGWINTRALSDLVHGCYPWVLCVVVHVLNVLPIPVVG